MNPVDHPHGGGEGKTSGGGMASDWSLGYSYKKGLKPGKTSVPTS